MTRAVLHPAADAEMNDSADWYDNQRAGVGREFLAAVDDALAAIEADPDTGVQVDFGFQMKTLRRFPFGVVFREHATELHVVAVHHFRRQTHYWLERE